ncbi:hypothetical protein A2767_04505 [Candidatus Roizmanbacteria bacterium RIFCSPHIGHO2_01_FULL_35_10]|uniref:Uncharacterized protein n=1 Tax=Candidatus Roizmanbacteria bacterium RIFCSPLOWO2_01_FULL_35_13 TaxID=1802055 RepID=A0A1F7IH49_9BACT|nr:MAG: hypothetical protein A2767_04505 [Candidatus Roizmanbacteria bacterium RIFCSPHIGHO2_01_FULL_35_10]OGK42645.1 MAG: hypothetical protein A3A74_06445 [Candidatus Roizmanbacteria bacterium RIFCSPLOWO2_01_FULL_35_13]
MKTLNYRLKQKLDEVYTVEPNNLGFPLLTNSYHNVTKFFKTMPFIFVIPLSFIIAGILYFVFGTLVVKLATLLQYGF